MVGSRRIRSSVLDTIGHTPIVQLDRLAPGSDHRIMVKLELLNPGGSHKVRIALAMISAAEEDGTVVRGSVQMIIEPTGGNTGIGLAMAAAVLGYRLVLVIPDNYSPAKQSLLKAFGAEIVLSDHRRGGNSHGEEAIELLFDNPSWVLLNQQANPAAHERTTALEILEDLGEDLPDALVAGVGTGGHLSGVGRVLRQHKPDLRIVAVVPPRCSFQENRFVHHDLQGLAVGLVPANLDVDLIDEEGEVEVDERSAAEMIVRLAGADGLAVGLSSAASLVATCAYAKRTPPGTRLLTFVYDSAQDYLGVLGERS